MSKFTELLTNDPRAKRKADVRVIFEGHGFQITELSGGVGDYWDVKWHDELDVREVGYRNLCISGRLDCINENDGQWFYNDAQHPMSAKFADDGSLTDEAHLIRSPGVTRLFFGDNTKRLCIYPLDAFGQVSDELVRGTYADGPTSFTLSRGMLLVLSIGGATANGAAIQSPNVVFAKTQDVQIDLLASSHGAVLWKD
jgi:hypothetical protein